MRKGISYVRVVSESAVGKGKLNQVENRGDVGRKNQNVNVAQNRRRAVNACSDDEWKGLTFNVFEDTMGWLKGYYIGQTHNTICPLDVQDSLHKAGIFYIKSVSMGVNYVLLPPNGEVGDVDLSKSLNDDVEGLSIWFVSIIPWDEGFVARDILVWLNIVGVPAHAWKEGFFQMLALTMGTYCAMEEGTRSKSRLDVGRILVSIVYPRIINNSVLVKINNLRCSIRLMEDLLGATSWKSSGRMAILRDSECSSDGSD